jgi:hypothetical protein
MTNTADIDIIIEHSKTNKCPREEAILLNTNTFSFYTNNLAVIDASPL